MAWTTPAATGPLDYPNRRYGNDHDRYAWSMLTDRPPLSWPQGKGLALFVVVPLQFFPLNPQGKPLKVPGNMVMPYPDLRHYTLRDCRLRELTGQAVRGWLSPGKLNSPNTPDLIAAAGIDYFCDWVNDELPYRWNTATGALWSMPLSTEISDTFVLVDNLHSEASWADQVCDAADLLHAEAAGQGGRILTLTLTPWLLGQPHRIKHLERVLDHVTGLGGVWSASGAQILDAAMPQIPAP